ncbi:MAG: ABC transporter ATP-binding protein [Anaerolineae bacterium]|nr:ABC transporter ATP-binding protein [Anaerolineae bacterium]
MDRQFVSSEFILETRNLSKSFGAVTAVHNLNLRVRAGEVFGFLGPNGAGKTTTIGMMLGLIAPSAGEVRLLGTAVTPAHTAALRQVGALVGTPALLPYLSGRDNLRLLAHLYADVNQARIDEMLALVKMNDAADRKLHTYSTGMKQRLGLAAALLHRPRLVVLDEPTNGLDPAGMREVRQLIRQLADDGITVFLSSHLLHEVEQVCDRIAVINKGQIVTQGAVMDLVGQTQQTVKLRVASPANAATALQALDDVVEIQTNGAYLQVIGVAPEAIVAHLAQHSIYPSELTSRHSDLEDVFLALTSSEEKV